MAPGCCRCQENGKGEVEVSSVLSCCSISESRIGISFMYEDEGAVLGIIEAKVNGNLRHDIQQTAAYALCPLAYSRWGRWGNAQPLVALLLTPRCLYRLTFAKSNVSTFGIYMTIKYTDDVDQMEFELYNYIQKYIDDFHHVKDRKFKDHLYVNPLDWTPMNLQLADLPPYPSNLTRWQVPCMSKYGFLFRTSSDAVTALQAKHGSKARFPSLRAGKAVYVKYLSALLDYCYESSVVSLTLRLASDRGEKMIAEAGRKRRAPFIEKFNCAKRKFVQFTGRFVKWKRESRRR